MQPSAELSGYALLGEELEEQKVRIYLEGEKIVCIEERRRVPETWICPALFNAHTHLGDSVAMDTRADGSLAELVSPPDGIKHRILAATPHADLVSAMRSSLEMMVHSGTAGCADFREGGVVGVRALQEASSDLAIRPVILGREGGEAIADGLGVSSVRDIADAESIVAHAKRMGKIVAIHAGERDPADVDRALALDPDLLIHCTHATDEQLRQCADRDIPIAVCPRSNWTLGVAESVQHPPLRRMQEIGCTLLLGTDNAMFIQPDMLREMSFVCSVYRLEPEDVMRAAIWGSKIFADSFFIKEGQNAHVLVIDAKRSNLYLSRNRCSTIVRRLSRYEIKKNVISSVQK